MKTTKLIFLFFFISTLTYAQVGINNTDPKASLDITATNQANPSNTDGLLIPRINAFPATNPTAAQNGMMVYLTTTSGTNTAGYYYWDNATSSWKAMLGTSDADFFETGGTPPNNINDDIYTNGKVNIGTNDFSTSTTFKINTSEITGASIQNNNASTPTGLSISLPADNANIKTGLSVNLSGINSNAYISSGIKTNFSTTGTNNSFDGIQQNFNGNSTNGIIKGLNNNFNSSSSYRNIFGISNIIDSEGIGEHVGVSNSLGGIASGKQKGNVTFIDNSGNGYHYGNYSILSGTGFGNKYGTYNEISTAAGGTHYGVYSNVLKSGSYAGYFLGKVSIGTSTSNNYMLPSSRGSNGQIMRTDGAGNLSWVTPTYDDADWYQQGTTNPPNNINDNIFTNGFVGIGDSTPDSKLDVEYTGTNSNGVTITYNYTGNTNPPAGLAVKSETSGTGANNKIFGAYIQTQNSNGSTFSTAVYGFNSADANYNYGISANTTGNGSRNIGVDGTASNATNINIGGKFYANYGNSLSKYGIIAAARGGSNLNWAGYFGEYVAPTAGSGNVYIQDLLQVDGNLKFTNGATNNYILKTDASGNATWVNPTTVFTNTQNTLNQAYNEGGAGAGRTITADNGALSIAGTDGFQVTGTYGSGTNLSLSGAGTRMFFNPRKRAFRAGGVSGTQWDNANIGTSSFAVGFDNIASGTNSVAMGSLNETSGNSSIASGSYTTASGNYSFAAGYGTVASGSSTIALGSYSKATGSYSTAFGSLTEALGDNSIAMGSYSKAYSFSEIALGIYPTIYTPSSTTVFNSSDRLFVIGNGIDSANKSNALTIYKSGLININDSYNLPLTDGAANQVIFTDGSGNLSWANGSSLGTDDQNLTGATLSGTSLQIDIENGTSTTVDLAPLQDADWYENGGTPPNSINDNIYTYGNVGIGTSSTSYRLDLADLQSSNFIARFNNTSTSTNADGIRIRLAASNLTTSNYFIGFYRGLGNTSGKIVGSGTGVLYQTSSDRRLKTNIVSIENSLDLIDKIQPKKYEYKANLGTKEYGFIAQELQLVYPQAVSGDPNGNVETDPMMVDYSRLTPILTAGIKELKKEVEILSQENQELKKQIRKYEDLEARLSAIENNNNQIYIAEKANK